MQCTYFLTFNFQTYIAANFSKMPYRYLSTVGFPVAGLQANTYQEHLLSISLGTAALATPKQDAPYVSPTQGASRLVSHDFLSTTAYRSTTPTSAFGCILHATSQTLIVAPTEPSSLAKPGRAWGAM